MSTSSIARQKRRKRQKQLPPILYSHTNPIILTTRQYENSSYVSSENGDCNSSSNAEVKSQTPDSGDPLPETTGCSYINCEVSSRFTGKIYVEDENGFREVDANLFFQSFNNGKLQGASSKSDLAIDLAYQAEKYFHNFSFLCHGLLGGLSFIETLLLIHLMISPSELQETLRHFQFLSQPIHNIFNFLCIICCVSAFDKFDIGSSREFFKYLKTCKLKIIVIIIYPICLILSFSTANVDEKLCLPEKNSTLWESFIIEGGENELFYWKTLSTAKCVGAVLAWFIISLEPNKNLFLLHLKNILQRNSLIAK
ncbi:hypothetical protein JTE90_024251 [Oedothorax gibbosus]|uniref:Uncharacterized protein n=1 Tax=Oedothorax gibbosus TaxID=931172 RepID=A0AAV6TX66_9ARAC|nr:hypothetical protein JTE90_024251 [Oedothorax gibbosus]